MSTSVVGHPNPASSWKQEVSLRIAAHQSRRGFSAAKPSAPAQIRQSSGSRAAQAAARVAARYAQAPSYSQVLAAPGHSGPRAAEPAPHAALRAQTNLHTATQPALAPLPSAPAGPRLWEPEVQPSAAPARPSATDREPSLAPPQPAKPHSLPDSLEAWESECSHSSRAPDFRLLPMQPVPAPVTAPAAPAPRDFRGAAFAAEDRWEKPALAPALVEEPWDAEELEPAEPALPIHANLIEFPRELVATRKMRPRRAEGPLAVESMGKQLSIFEVDPGAISTGAEAIAASHAASWPESDWSGIELEAQSPVEPEPQEQPVPQLAPELAPLTRRLMATAVDGALIAAFALGSALAARASFSHPPAARTVEITAVAALLLVGMVYQTLFITLAEATPGMRCTGISLCTFDGQIPTGAQMRSRLGALLLSVVPMGLGVAWALFDEDHLCWHDRLSRTYLRTC